MPDPKDNAKATGDLHQPDLDDLARRTRDGRPVAEDSDNAAEEIERQQGGDRAGMDNKSDGNSGRS
jgi:hypothetical protein